MTGFERLRGIPTTPSGENIGWVRRWRREQLMVAGYDELSAHRLATRTDLDLHAVLVQRERCIQAFLRSKHPVVNGVRNHG